MADVIAIDNQRDAMATPLETALPMDGKQCDPVMAPVAATDKLSDKTEDNQLTHDQPTTDSSTTSDDADDVEDGEDDIRQSDVDRRLTWIGEGLLNGEGLDAVEQFMHLPSAASPTNDTTTSNSSVTEEPTSRVTRSGSKLLDFLAKEEGYVPNQQPPTVANVRAPTPSKPAPSKSAVVTSKRQSKLLDFLAADVGEKYLDDVYQDEDREDESEPASETTTPTPQTPTAVHANNKLLAFLARERGERLHEVEKTDAVPLRPEPYGVTLRFQSTEETKNQKEEEEAVVPSSSSSSSSPSSPPPVEPSAERTRLEEFVRNVQPPSRPKFVIFNPEDLVSSSSSSGSEGEESSSPTGHVKELRLKKRGAPHRTVRFANPGLDLQSGVVRQGIVDHYGREELLDFVVQVDESSLPVTQRKESAPPPAAPRTTDSSPPRRASPPPPPASVVAPPPGRLAAFLRKFSSKSSKSGSDSGGSRSNSPEVHSTPPLSTTAVAAPPPPPVFSAHRLPPSQPAASAPVERKPFTPHTTEPSAKHLQLLSSLRQLVDDAEKNDLSDLAVVRISILLSTVSQIMKEDLSKERPSSILRRLSMLDTTTTVTPTPATQQPAAPWVRSNQAMEEYERGHTTTTADIEAAKPMGSPPATRTLSPHLTLLPVDGASVSDLAMTAFTAFETAQNLPEILAAFAALRHECSISDAAAATPLRVYSVVKSGLYTQLAFRQKQLFRLLDAKLATDVYARQPCLGKRVCVVGCGPVGLRAAVELALMGAQVVVIDKRKLFSRENILHLWPWVVQDLTSLGAKVFFPQFCHSSAYFHVGTRQLQCILLKVALLLGVTVYPGTSFEGLASPDSGRQPFYSVVTRPQLPWLEFTAVLGACGTKDKLCAHAGIKRFVFSRKEAIGLVCYFPNLGTNDEKRVKEFSWTLQFKQKLFATMRATLGVDLENVVYYRGEYHYLVMTPKRGNLLAQGVLKINYPTVGDLVGVDNIDAAALNDYVARIINFFEIPQKSEFARVRLFDFSARTRAAQAATVLNARGKKLYVGLVGDALMEPFWPEGLGTCRGFLSAMDACWMVAQAGKQTDEQLLADRELGYRIVQHVSGFQRDDLQKNVRKYTVDPASRYTVQYPAAVMHC